MIGIRYKEKYSRAYYSTRYDDLEHLSTYFDTDKTVMVITGKAGTGKSSFVCDVSTNEDPDRVIVLQDCAVLELEEDESLDDYLHKILGLPRNISLINAFSRLVDVYPDKKFVFL